MSELFRPGNLIDTKGIRFSLGGVVANTGLALKRFGMRVSLMGIVGNDTLGDIAMVRFREEKLASGIRRSAQVSTAYGIVIALPGMDRIFLEDAGCNGAFAAGDVHYETVARSRLFHFGYPTLMRKMWVNGGRELWKMFKRVRNLGVATSLDMALLDSDSAAGRADWRAILEATLPFVDIFVPSIEEILLIMDRGKYNRILAKAAGRDLVNAIPQEIFVQLADELLAMGVRVLMIKAGQRGAYLRTGNVGCFNSSTTLNIPAGNWDDRRLWIPSYPAAPHRVKNACGAGDCAAAGFFTALLNGMEIEKAARCAMLAGRDSLYGTDACSGLSSWTKMTATIERNVRRQKT